MITCQAAECSSDEVPARYRVTARDTTGVRLPLDVSYCARHARVAVENWAFLLHRDVTVQWLPEEE